MHDLRKLPKIKSSENPHQCYDDYKFCPKPLLLVKNILEIQEKNNNVGSNTEDQNCFRFEPLRGKRLQRTFEKGFLLLCDAQAKGKSVYFRCVQWMKKGTCSRHIGHVDEWRCENTSMDGNHLKIKTPEWTCVFLQEDATHEDKTIERFIKVPLLIEWRQIRPYEFSFTTFPDLMTFPSRSRQ